MSIVFVIGRIALAGALAASFGATAANNDALQEVVVSASRLREQSQLDAPASVSVLTAQTLADSARQHFEEVIAQAPNLNWAAGSSRARYLQIRGIGELEQYEGAPNSSVGFLIDEIDFSGVGMAATLFDVSQVEVLRGPQGARLGANALAGLIAVTSAAPSERLQARVAADAGDYGSRSLGMSVSAPVESLDSAWRLSAQKYRSDGFRTNAFLDRKDTNGRDELTARGKWRWRAGERAQLDLTFMHADLQNGYDAFAIDNSLTTLSDRPGQDSQRVDAGSIKWSNAIANDLTFTAIGSALSSNSVHAFDGDWGNAQSWAPYTYDYLYRADRKRQTQTLEARIASAPLADSPSTAWLVGAYARRLRERIGEVSWGQFVDPDPLFGYAFATDDRLQSRFVSNVAAAFAQLDARLARQWTASLGLRTERYRGRYQDAGVWGGDPNRISDDDNADDMLGGHASLTFEAAERARIYAAIDRGYKAGGFNLGGAGARQPTFDPEYLWNYELGVKTEALERALYADAALFYMRRVDMQVRSGQQLTPGDPNSFVFVTQNVASGYNYGLETSLRWTPIKSLQLGVNVGLLRTRESGLVSGTGGALTPRAQAHAPEHQVQLQATYRVPRGFMARIDWSTVGAFYFDAPTAHDERSKPYDVTNIKIGYEAEQWSVHAWLRNAFDKRYATRGFYFGNEPPLWESKLYIQNGDPRQAGASFEWRFN